MSFDFGQLHHNNSNDTAVIPHAADQHGHSFDNEASFSHDNGMPPPPPVYPNKKRCVNHPHPHGEESNAVTMSLVGNNKENSQSDEQFDPREWTNGGAAVGGEDVHGDPNAEHGDMEEPKEGGTATNNEEGTEEQQQEREQAAEEEWNALVDEIQADPDSLYCQDLQVWQEAGSRRQDANQRLHTAFETCEKALDANVDFMIQSGVAVPLHEHCRKTLTQRFQDICTSMRNNHERRQDLLKRLQDRNHDWEKTYRTLTARVQDQDVSLLEEEEERPSNGMETMTAENPGQEEDKEDGGGSNGDSTGENGNGGGDEEDAVVQEPDWDTIAQEHVPSRDNIRRLLQARDEMEAAELRLETALEDIHAGLKECTATILQAVVELHQDATERLDHRQDDIQNSLASNFRRNQDLEKAIEESAKQAQGVFSSLMARLKATAKSATTTGAAAAGSGAAVLRRK